MWRRGNLLGLFIMAVLLAVEGEENVPKSMEPDLKFSYNLDKMTSLNFGVRTPSDFEYITNKRKYINQYVLWFNVEF
ncbi:hypothetical protein [Hydrogenobacter thermophilus]|uniref:hypothetical protein n=1 Tax=Hydrogenobacter thermophilus TaxID=940 RepID=UPI0030FC5FBC